VSYQTKDIRNIAFAGHSSAGKTSLVEALLYLTKAKDRLGKVEEGSTTTDYESDEIERGLTIGLSLASVNYKDYRLNLVDLPGYPDFFGEVVSGLKAVDCMILVVDAVSGVEVGTNRAIHCAREGGMQAGIPIVVFINRMDKERANYQSALNSLKDSFDFLNFTSMTIPIGSAESFKGVVDLLSMKAYMADEPNKAVAIPEEIKAVALEQRMGLMESACEVKDELVEKYLEQGEISQEEFEEALTLSISARNFVPILCGSAFNLCGVDVLLKHICSALPSPLERGMVSGHKPGTGEVIQRPPDSNASLSSIIFKTTIDPYAGKLSFVRVFSGILHGGGSETYNSTKGQSVKVGALSSALGKEQKPLNQVIAGDIGVIAKLEGASTGDTLCNEKDPIVFAGFDYPEATMRYAITPKSKGDEDKLSTAVGRLSDEDPTFIVTRDKEIRQTVAFGQGEMHLEVAFSRLKSRFGVDIEYQFPRVPYKETVKKSSKAQGRYKKQTGGRGQFGDVWLEINPKPRGQGFEFENRIVGGVVPNRFIPSVEKGIVEAMEGGVISGNPVVDVKAILYDGSYHTVDSSDMAFKIAGSFGFKKAFELADPTILEPIYEVEVTVPEEFAGDITGDLSGKRGKVSGMEPSGKLTTIRGSVPLGEMYRYSIELRSMTQGKGTFTLKFSHYEEAPPDVRNALIEKYQKERAEGGGER